MAIVQCSNNHYYDDKRNTVCPYCEKLNAQNASVNVLNEQLTSYLDVSEIDDNAQLTEGYREDVSEFEKTIGIFTDETQNLLTVGWLVCTSGAVKGKSYVIHPGRNFAGRSEYMDIVLSDDNTLAREKHFSIVYDPKSIAFYLVSGSGHTYVNGKMVSSEKEIVEGDVVRAGQSEYIFIPFCKEGRDWN